ncbi:UNVERIFIED_CONTAM: hypothetical protein PYX00_004700 [Menopon gallinae]|uniref:phosphoinositide 5-phosphatase n=1 Tax=Menopon gallinae TaxID=328185 RepID=A0AAW2I4W6_9NEOP
MAMGKGFRVFEKVDPPNPYSVLLDQRTTDETLLFESQVVAVLTPQETETMKKNYSKMFDAYGCLGVLQLSAGENTVLYLVMVTGCVSVGKLENSEVFRITQTNFVSLRNQPQDEERISEVRRLLNSGTFYFSWSNTGEPLDLTLCAQRRRITSLTDNRFFWNRMLHIHFLRFSVNCSQWALKAMCGSVEIRTVYVGHRQAKACIISRLSCERAGTRFNVRGSNDDGHVANFVETEQLIVLEDEITSYVQTRGSVPLFWEQPGIQVGSHKVKMSRGFDASHAAFERHLMMIRNRYGHQAIINLLGSSMIGSKEGEAVLSNLFQAHHKASEIGTNIPHILFDYHQECRGGNTKNLSKLKAKIDKYLRAFSLFYAKGSDIITQQRGTIRTNCLDCLDRTNCVQTFLGLEILGKQLHLLRLMEKQQMVSRFEEVFRQLWINNGNEISKIYAGTGAIQGSSKLMDGARSAARTIQNNLLDNSKQEAIDILLLGSTLNSELSDRARILLPQQMQHAPTSVLREMCNRCYEYVYTQKIRVAVGTYNVNGGKHFRSVAHKDISLRDWLLDAPKMSKSRSLVDVTNDQDKSTPIDIFAIGFEEIVDLNAGNIVAASTENAKAWAEELQKALSRDETYVLITYMQLVGVCLYLFVHKKHAPYVRDVALDSVKTGFGGATGNKAGQSQVSERNADYAEITRKITFPMGRTLNSHDYVFWCGDFNYRIDMDKEELKEALRNNDISKALSKDQLKVQMEQGNVFKNFIEGDINFHPTYKYDLFSDDYDTSEKQRAPAWTDRVLWRRRKVVQENDANPSDWNPGSLVFYGRAELKQSDHRPVIAIIDVDIFRVNDDVRKQVFTQVVQDLGPPDSTVVMKILGDDAYSVFDETFMFALLQELCLFGEVTLIRFVDDTMWATFRDGQSALSAAKKGTTQVCGHTLNLSLRTTNWTDQAERELELCSNNTVSLCEDLDLDFRVSPSDIPPDEVLKLVSNTIVEDAWNAPAEEERTGPAPPRPAPPSRPPQPMSPAKVAPPRPRAGVISVPTRTAPQVPPPPNPALVGKHQPQTNGLAQDASEQNHYETASAIYEEIRDDDRPAPTGLPPPPPRYDSIDSEPTLPACPPPLPQRPRAAPSVPDRAAPPIPARSGAPPPIPARSGAPPPNYPS